MKEHLDEIEIASAAQLTASAKDWLKDLELIRSKTANSMQGSLNGKMRERLGVLHRVLDTLAIRAEEKGDIAYLKMRNTELQAQLLVSQRETKRLHRRLDEMQRTINEMRRLMEAGKRVPRENKATSPLEANTRERSASRPRNKGKDKAMPSQDSSLTEAVMRPPLKGVSVPIPSGGSVGNYDEILTQQITALVERRKQLRQGSDAVRVDRVGGKEKRDLPKIISNVQIVPPGRATRSEILTGEEEEPQTRNTVDDGWQAVVKKSVKKKKYTEGAREKQTTRSGSSGTRGSKPKEGNKSMAKRRAPRTAAHN